MRRRFKRSFVNKTSLYILFILTVLSGIVFFSEEPERILGTSNALKSEVNAIPFAVAHDTTTNHYENDGQLSYSFNASRLEHYREGEEDNANIFTLVDQPELVFYQKDEPWFVQAQKGKITSSTQLIELWRNVSVKHTNKDGVVTRINTEILHIDPVSKLAKTDEPVKISSEKVEITGKGMSADFVGQKLKLKSKVHGFYDPT